MIPAQLAEDFDRFCEVNYGPLPLLYKSRPGETGAPLLAEDSDVRTDLPAYQKLVKGVIKEIPTTLIDYQWDNMVSFYLGCSYSFEENLAEAGIALRNVVEDKIVSVFITNIACQTVGPFGCTMCCSMRPIKIADLVEVVRITGKTPSGHGSPVHIGDPSRIGVKNALVCDIGESTIIKDDEVPVFWACGVTVASALQTAAPELGFTHKPGHMYVADVPVLEWDKDVHVPGITLIEPLPGFYSYVSNPVAEKIAKLEQSNLIKNQGDSFQQHSLLRVLLALSHSSKVAILVSSPKSSDILQYLSLVCTLCAFSIKVTLLAKKDDCVTLDKCVAFLKSTFTGFKDVTCQSLEETKERYDTCINFSKASVPISFDADAVVNVCCLDSKIHVSSVPNKWVTMHMVAKTNTAGGHVLSGGLFTVMQCPMHWRYRQHAIGDRNASVAIEDCLVTDEEVRNVHGVPYMCGFLVSFRAYHQMSG
jgi:uncharacterized protein YcsI (UPF0317 family)